MKSASQWFAEYGESHQNSTNKLIHWVCVPAIFWSVALLLWAVPVPESLAISPWVNWATLALALMMVFYALTSISIAVGMLVVSVVIAWLTQWTAQTAPWSTWQIGLVIFIVAWIFQFIGHKIEGKKPSFFKDILYLLVGPAWLMGFIYQKLGIKYA
ncbi:MAG: DUF962 domain-containing protein [Gammaproteobacteria bacterium]|nr:DUF962 domain-containing protein [Gammaproteobacteria bacterium]